MKKLLSILKMQNLKRIGKDLVSRFPITLAIIVITTLLFLFATHGEYNAQLKEILGKLIFTGIITFFLSIGVYLSCEACKVVPIKRHLFQIAPLLFGLLFYISFDSNIDNFENAIYFILTLVGILSYLFFAPYLKKKTSTSVYYTYFYNISVSFLISYILGGVLFTLGAIGIIAVITLFDLENIISSKIYQDWAIIALVFLTPLFGLVQIPKKETFTENYFNENAFFSFLIKYIAIPFIYIYFIILYAYSLKVLLSFGDWPKGEVSWMVIGFSIFGYVTYIFSYIFEQKNRFVVIFRKYFPFAVIPQVFMLFYAIYLRIGQYDITINRYFVVVFGIWLLIISLYYAFGKAKSLKVIPAILTLFVILISIGPGSIYSLPEARQLERLKENLVQANILQENSIFPLKTYEDIDQKLSGEIYSGIKYVCNFNDCSSIKEMFPNIYGELETKHKQEFINRNKNDLIAYKDDEMMTKHINNRIYTGPNRWDIVRKISETIKVKTYYNYNSSNQQEYIHIYSDGSFFPLKTLGYSEMLQLTSRSDSRQDSYAYIDIPSKKLYLIKGGVTISTTDITNVISQLREIYEQSNNRNISKDKLIFEVSNNQYKLLLSSMSLPNSKFTGVKNNGYYYVDGYVLIK